MIYSFYDPDLESLPGMGNFIIMDHITRAARAGLAFVYLGYWIEGCSRMAYKTKFRPVEALIGGQWREVD